MATCSEDTARIAEAAALDLRDAMGQHAEELEICRACRSEVADLGEVRSLAEVHALDQFRNQDVQVGVTLAVTVARQVHRHPVDARGEVSAVIEVEAAQEELVRLPRAGMLRENQAGHGFKHFTGTRERAPFKLFRTDGSFGSRFRDADQAVLTPLHENFRQARRFIGGLSGGGAADQTRQRDGGGVHLR